MGANHHISLAVTPPSPLPSTAPVRELLDKLVEVAVSTDAATVRPRPSQWHGLCLPLARDNGILAGALLADTDFALGASAALRGQASTPSDDPLTDDVVDATREILEALAALMNGPATPHVSSDGCHRLPGVLPAPVAALLAHPYNQREFVITFGEHGKGRLTALIW